MHHATSQKLRGTAFLQGCRFADSKKLGACQLLATLIACLSLLLAGFAFWVSFDSLRYARWAARKEFLVLCRDEELRGLSPECGFAEHLSLSAPPGFSGEGLDNEIAEYAVQDDSGGNTCPRWSLSAERDPVCEHDTGLPPTSHGP